MGKKKWAIVLILILLAAGAAYYWFHQKGHRRRGDVTTERVQAKLGSIQDSVEATGEVLPLNRVAINAPVAGRINQLLVAEGDTVKAGQILAWMSSTDRAAILDAARAQGTDAYKQWSDAYKPTPIVAPLNGTIILLNVVVGQTVDTTVAIYAMSDKLIVKADVDETDVGRIRMGMEAVVTLDSYPDKPINGNVFQILYEGVNTSNVITYGVKINPRSVPPFFRSQMTANIKLITKQKDNVVLLPEAAITPTASGERQVMIPGPKNKPVPQIVQVGLENGEQAEITSGVQEGDTVLVIRQRYAAQQATASSPLVMGGTTGRGSGGGGGGGGRGTH